MNKGLKIAIGADHAGFAFKQALAGKLDVTEIKDFGTYSDASADYPDFAHPVALAVESGEFDFGILTSAMHMAWLRNIGGRLESRYRYSIGIVYNTFPWPDATEAQKEKICTLAQAVLDARARYPDATLADLYEHPVVPYDEDAVTRLIHDDLQRPVYETVKSWTVSRLREYVLDDRNDGAELLLQGRRMLAAEAFQKWRPAVTSAGIVPGSHHDL